MSMNKTKICDYSNYDYQTEFWTNKNREYEHGLEDKLISTLIRKYANNKKAICDAGCGFGRLFNSYKRQFEEYHLVDYADNLLKQAKDVYGSIKSIHFYKQSLYEMKINKKVDSIISIRTLHHLENVDLLFQSFNKNLNDNGILILDIPNHYHIKNKLKHPFKKKKNKVMLSESYYNYRPQFIIEKLNKNGLNVIDKYQVGLFRIGFIKRIFPPNVLISLEMTLNIFLKSLNIAPSVYIVAKKECG